MDDLQLDLNQAFEMLLERDTFVDPNGDSLNITGTRIPAWMRFSRNEMKLTGTPTLYGVYNVSITAKDAWNASATMSFQIVAGIQPNTPPIVLTKLKDQQAFLKELFFYRLPPTAFNDSDGDPLFYLVSQANGNYLPNWLIFEEITQTFSGIPESADPLQNVTDITTVLVVADDRRGGIAKQEFNITLIRIEPEKPTYSGLIIVSCLMGAFLMVVGALICKRQCQCCKGKKKKSSSQPSADGQPPENEETDDSYDEDDDIIVADAKPKNPFRIIQESDIDQQKYKLYGPESKLPSHAQVLEHDLPTAPVNTRNGQFIEEEFKQ